MDHQLNPYPDQLSDVSGTPINPATEEKQDAIITAVKNPSGTASNGTVTLTSASTAYAIPTSAPTTDYTMIVYNGSNSDMYLGFATLTTGGILLPAGGTLTVDIGASKTLFAYCTSAGKIANYSLIGQA